MTTSTRRAKETIILIGNAGKDPVLKQARSGNQYAEFTMATYQGKDKPARWWKVIAMGPVSETAMEIVRRGSKIEVEGKFDFSETEDKEGKVWKNFTCLATRIQPQTGESQGYGAPIQVPEIDPLDNPPIDDIPFSKIPF